MSTTTLTPPTAWPTRVVGGRTYICRFDQMSFFLANEWKYDILSILGSINNPAARISDVFGNGMKLWALFTANNFVDPERPLNGEQWAASIPDDDFETFKSLYSAVLEAIQKRQADRIQKVTPNPPTVAVTEA